MSDSQGEPELKRDSESADVVEIAGKWLALLAVLLPAAGLLVRYVAYSLALPNESALRLAWSTTLIELSVIGFVSILLPAALVILAEIAYRLLRGPLNRIRERSARTKRAVIILLLVVTGIAFAFVPGWPISIVLVLGVFGVGYLDARLSRKWKQRTISHFWPVLILFIIVGAVSFGLVGALPGISRGQYEFTSSKYPAGVYLQVGREGRFVYLVRCPVHEHAYAVAVPEDSIERYQLVGAPHSSPPDLWDVAFHHQSPRVGLRSAC